MCTYIMVFVICVLIKYKLFCLHISSYPVLSEALIFFSPLIHTFTLFLFRVNKDREVFLDLL